MPKPSPLTKPAARIERRREASRPRRPSVGPASSRARRRGRSRRVARCRPIGAGARSSARGRPARRHGPSHRPDGWPRAGVEAQHGATSRPLPASAVTRSPSKATAPRMRTSRTRPQTRIPSNGDQPGAVRSWRPSTTQLASRSTIVRVSGGGSMPEHALRTGRDELVEPLGVDAALAHARGRAAGSSSRGRACRPAGRRTPSPRGCAARGRSRRRRRCRRRCPPTARRRRLRLLQGRSDAAVAAEAGRVVGGQVQVMGRHPDADRQALAPWPRAGRRSRPARSRGRNGRAPRSPARGRRSRRASGPRHGPRPAAARRRLQACEVRPPRGGVGDQQVPGRRVAVHLQPDAAARRVGGVAGRSGWATRPAAPSHVP